MITIIDYGLGNIRAFSNVYEKLKVPIQIATTSEDVSKASKIILPGVGSFDYAMIQLRKSGMLEELEKQVLIKRIPVLGICVGMQILANGSDEGKLPGLGWIEGRVRLFDKTLIQYKTRLPHMGWNTVNVIKEDRFVENLNKESRFYFLHSYYFECKNEENILAKTEYGTYFDCVVKKDNIYGVQFHPEKSHENGVRLLKNFAEL